AELEDELYYHIFNQFLCFMQLGATKKYAAENGVMLMGDIPILISPDSADVWSHPDYFDLGFAAGAPPDIFNEEGQYWGFPIYNWKAMEKHDYRWWCDRLKYAENFYDLYRIDHVLGLFHLWSIPRGKKPSEGSYLPEGAEGVDHGRRLLEKLVKTTGMMPIAEDIGIIPEAVFQTLHELGIPGTRCIRWQRNWETDKRYFPYEEYYPINMTTLSTHDSETVEQWWKDRPDEAKLFCEFKGWKYETPLSYEKRLEMLRDAHHTPTYFHINLLQEYLALVPELVWGKPEDERINIPGYVLPTNWTYRYKPSINQLITHEALFKEMEKIIK
ncbi:MAG: 4-alpha-glucanotransferase, partial [Simkaniaceae bacterium]|nr:4-alpha-glucanotransferase [Simkaniaceae bacterium]